MRVQLSFFTINWHNPEQSPQSIVRNTLENEKVAYEDLISGIQLDAATPATLAVLAKCHDQLSANADDVAFYINVTKEKYGFINHKSIPTNETRWVQFKRPPDHP